MHYLNLLVNRQWPLFLQRTSSEDMQKAPKIHAWRRMASNLATAEKYKFLLAQTLTAAIEQHQLEGPYEPIRMNGGWRTLLVQGGEDWLTKSLDDPRDRAVRQAARIHALLPQDKTVAVAGIGDGHLLGPLFDGLHAAAGGSLPPIYVIEPDPRRVLACLQIHHWTKGARTPLSHPSALWIVGSDWEAQLRALLESTPMLPVPSFSAGNPEIEATLRRLSGEIRKKRRAFTEQTVGYHSWQRSIMSIGDMVRLLTAQPGQGSRRALLVGNRHHPRGRTDLDATCAALDAAGWETTTLIESSPLHRMSAAAVAGELKRSHADLLVSIHQPLFERKTLIPDRMPSLGIVMDDRNLLEAAAPYSLTVCNTQAFSPGHLRAEIDIAEGEIHLAPGICPHPEAILDPRSKDEEVARSLGFSGLGGMTLAYWLGNAPPPLATLLEAALEQSPKHCQGAVLEVGEQLIKETPAGDFSAIGLQARLLAAAPTLGPVALRDGIHALMPLANALYILETVLWMVAETENSPMAFTLYGDGWERFPNLAKHARPALRSRGELARVVRQGTFGIHAEPGFMLTQPFMEAVSAGGFFLVREHPVNAAVAAMAQFIVTRVPLAQDLPAAQAALDDAGRTELGLLGARMSALLPQGDGIRDHIRLVRACIAGGLIDNQCNPLPGYTEVCFNSAESLMERLRHYTNNPVLRRQLVKAQGKSLLERMGMQAHLRRAVDGMAAKLKKQGTEDPKENLKIAY